MLKICNKCNTEKDISCFYKRDSTKYRNECKECWSLHKKEKYNENKYNEEYMNHRREKSRNFKENNKEKISISGKDYYTRNKEEINKKHRKYYNENKIERYKKINEYRNLNKDKVLEWAKNRRKDPFKKLIYNIRCLIYNSLSERGYTKKSKTQEILGCSYIEFKNHIESQFQSGMSWENRNEWHIDHIVPLDFAKDENEILKLNHYTNLRPLFATENLSKSNSITIKTESYYEIIDNR